MSNTLINNPLLQPFVNPYGAPPFDLIREEHFIPAIETLIREAEGKIGEINACPEGPTFENTILPLEQNGERLGIIAGILFNLNHAETNEKLQAVAQEASQLLTGYSSRMLMNPALFSRIDTLYGPASEPAHQPATCNLQPATSYLQPATSPEQATVLRNWHRDFIRNGARLDEASKMRFAEIRMELSRLTLQFADNVLAETNGFFLHLDDEAGLSGLPDFVKEAAAQEAESRQLKGWVFTLHAPGYVPFMKYSDRRDLREKMAGALGDGP